VSEDGAVAGAPRASAPVRVLRGLAALSLPAAGITVLVLLPRLTGTTWAEVLDVLRGVRHSMLPVLVVVWLAGLLTYTRLQTAALPGLTPGRALALNLSGSAIANGIPGGGAFSNAATWAMARSWGFSGSAFAVYAVVTNVVVALSKVTLPVVAVGMLAAVGRDLITGPMRTAALVAGGALPALVALLALLWWLSGRRPGGLVARLAGTGRLGRLTGRVSGWWLETREAVAAVFRAGWRWMLVSVVGYALLQFLLLLLCLRLTGARVDPLVVFVAFAVGRFLTVLPITPGGLGVTETGTTAVLVTLGVAAATADAAVLLFTVFVVVLEIPVGAVSLGWWYLSARRPAH
jgi:putative heme transporter